MTNISISLEHLELFYRSGTAGSCLYQQMKISYSASTDFILPMYVLLQSITVLSILDFRLACVSQAKIGSAS